LRWRKGGPRGRPKEKRADREAEERRVRMQFEQAKLDHELRMLEMRARPTQLGEGDGGYGLTRPSLDGRVIWRYRQSDLGK